MMRKAKMAKTGQDKTRHKQASGKKATKNVDVCHQHSLLMKVSLRVQRDRERTELTVSQRCNVRVQPYVIYAVARKRECFLQQHLKPRKKQRNGRYCCREFAEKSYRQVGTEWPYFDATLACLALVAGMRLSSSTGLPSTKCCLSCIQYIVVQLQPGESIKKNVVRDCAQTYCSSLHQRALCMCWRGSRVEQSLTRASAGV